MNSDNTISDNITDYLDLLDRIDKKSQSRGMSGVTITAFADYEKIPS